MEPRTRREELAAEQYARGKRSVSHAEAWNDVEVEAAVRRCEHLAQCNREAGVEGAARSYEGRAAGYKSILRARKAK